MSVQILRFPIIESIIVAVNANLVNNITEKVNLTIPIEKPNKRANILQICLLLIKLRLFAIKFVELTFPNNSVANWFSSSSDFVLTSAVLTKRVPLKIEVCGSM